MTMPTEKCYLVGTPYIGYLPFMAETREKARYRAVKYWPSLDDPIYADLRAERRPQYDGMTEDEAYALWSETEEARSE